MPAPDQHDRSSQSPAGRWRLPRFQYRLGTLLGLVVASAVGWGIYRAYRNPGEPVLVAAVDIPAGTQLQPPSIAMLAIKPADVSILQAAARDGNVLLVKPSND